LDAPALNVAIGAGMLDIRHANIPTSELVLRTAALSIRMKKDIGTRIHLKAGSGVDASAIAAGLCMSDFDNKPMPHDDAGTLYFDLGGPTTSSHLVVVRGSGSKSAPGQIFVSRDVDQALRTSANTHDSTDAAELVAEGRFGAWAKMMRDVGIHLLRFRVLGPGLDDAQGGLLSRGEWLYSVHGDVYVWHSSSLFWLATLGLFAPRAAREDVLLVSAKCIPVVTAAQALETCDLESAASLYERELTIGGIHAALWKALPLEMQSRNMTYAELYFVEAPAGGLHRSDKLSSSIADGTVSKFKVDSLASDGHSLVSFTASGNPDKFMRPQDRAFVAMGFIVDILATIVICVLVIRGYIAQRDRILMSEGHRIWPLLWNAEQKRHQDRSTAKAADVNSGKVSTIAGERSDSTRTLEWTAVFESPDTVIRKQVEQQAHHLIADSVHLFTFLDAAVLGRMPGAFMMDGLPAALGTVLVHFAVVVVLGCLPLYLVSWLQVHNSVFRQIECAIIDLVQSDCGLPSVTLPVVGMIVTITAMCFMLFYTIVDYLARHIDYLVFADGRPANKRISRHRRRLLQIGSSSVFNFVFWILSVLLLVCTCVYFIGFCLYLTLGACVDPTRLLPVLFAVIAVLVVGRSTYAQLMKLQVALKARLDGLHGGAEDAVALGETAEATLREMGLNSTQILLITLAVCIAFSAFIAFLLLGCLIFITTESIVPTLISSGLVLLSAVAVVNQGQVTGKMVSGNDTAALLSSRFVELSSWTSLMTEAAAAKDTKAELAAAKALNAKN